MPSICVLLVVQLCSPDNFQSWTESSWHLWRRRSSFGSCHSAVGLRMRTALKHPRLPAHFLQALHPPQEMNCCLVRQRMLFSLQCGYLLHVLRQGRAGSSGLGEGHWRQSLQHHVLHDDLVHLGVLHQHHLYHIWEEVTPGKKVRALSASDRQERHLDKCPYDKHADQSLQPRQSS